MSGLAIDISILLFIISLKMDKVSSLRLFALLDENRRKILENLEVERTFDDLKTLYQGGTYITALAENLKYLKKAGLIKEKKIYVKEESKNRMLKKFIRSF